MKKSKNIGYINKGIDDYIRRAKHRFHTPGHKGVLDRRDITEIDAHFPAECITAAQNKAAVIYGAEQARFLTQGSSIGNKAAIIALTRLADGSDRSKGIKVLCEARCHKSVVDGIILSGAEPIVADNTQCGGLYEPLTGEQVEKILKKHPAIKLVVLTSPDYYGYNAESDAARAVQDAGKFLHIDSAHGAHYPFRKDLFDNEIYTYADSAVFSVHKTLPAYTQTSLLAVYERTHIDTFDRALSLLGTTSPSYPMLASIEEAVDIAHNNAHRYDLIKAATDGFRARVKCAPCDDFTRLVVDAFDLGLTGGQLYEGLYSCGFIAEKYDRRYCIFIVTLCDSQRAIAKLSDAILRLRVKK